MALSERLLGKRNVTGRPRIEHVDPPAALPGGEVRIVGSGLKPPELTRPRVQIDEVDVPIVVSSDDFVIANAALRPLMRWFFIRSRTNLRHSPPKAGTQGPNGA